MRRVTCLMVLAEHGEGNGDSVGFFGSSVGSVSAHRDRSANSWQGVFFWSFFLKMYLHTVTFPHSHEWAKRGKDKGRCDHRIMQFGVGVIWRSAVHSQTDVICDVSLHWITASLQQEDIEEMLFLEHQGHLFVLQACSDDLNNVRGTRLHLCWCVWEEFLTEGTYSFIIFKSAYDYSS